MATNDIGTPVELYVYDLSQGMASLMAPMLINCEIDGIWHTSIVAYGMEYFFGSSGIQMCKPESTVLGAPLRKEKLGDTFVPYTVFRDFIQALGDSTYAGSEYNLTRHNCNNFSEEVAQFLCGVHIPKYILELPEVLLSTPLGQSLRPLIERVESSAQAALPINAPVTATRREESPDFLQLNSEIEKVRYNSLKLEERRNSLNEKLARKERKKEKKKRKLLKEQQKEKGAVEGESVSEGAVAATEETAVTEGTTQKVVVSTMAENGSEAAVNGGSEDPSQGEMRAEHSRQLLDDVEEQERREEEERKKNREPPIVYRDEVDVKADFEQLSAELEGRLGETAEGEETRRWLSELRQYMLEDEGSWALGDGFLPFLGRILRDPGLPDEMRVKAVRLLAAAALKDDVILLLHQDRREHVLMNYATEVDRLPLDEQKAVALFMSNMFENVSSSEWLLYISEWTYGNQITSNIRVTTKVAVHCLLSEDAELRERGTAIVHNMACKEVKTVVFDDVAVELTMALLQFFQGKHEEELLYRCMKALARFTQVSSQEVPQLIQMIGPDPQQFRGTSERVDELITMIAKKLR